MAIVQIIDGALRRGGKSDRAGLKDLQVLLREMATNHRAVLYIPRDLSAPDDGHHKFVLVRARERGPVVAFAVLEVTGFFATIEHFYCSTRGRGHARLTLGATEDLAREMSAQTIEALPHEPEQAAWFVKHGYRHSEYGYMKPLLQRRTMLLPSIEESPAQTSAPAAE